MKRLIIFILSIQGIIGNISAQNRSVNFQYKKISELKEQAKKENKLLFLDFSPPWCKPCKKMDKEVFTNDSVADYFNKYFVSTTITNIDTLEGKLLADKYNITVFPTFLFFDGDSLVHRGCCYKNPKITIQLGTDAVNPDKQLYTSIHYYYKGEKDVKSVAKLLEGIEMACAFTESEKIINNYIDSKKDEELLTENGWHIIKHVSGANFTSDFNSSGCRFFLKNHNKWLLFAGDSAVNTKTSMIITDAVFKIIGDTTIKNKERKIIELKNIISQINPANKKIFSANADLTFYSYPFNLKFIEAAMSGAVEKFYWYNSWVLNDCARKFYEHVDDKTKLQRAVTWSERSIKLDNQSESNDTYAHLLFKLGETDKAIEIEKDAIQIASKQSHDIKDYENALKQFKQTK